MRARVRGEVRGRCRALSFALLLVLVLPVAACRGEGAPGDADGPATGTPAVPSGPGPADRVVTLPGNAGARGLALAPDGTLWVAEAEVGGVAGIDPAGAVTQHRVSGNADMVNDIARAADGTVWFATGELVGQLAPAGRLTRWRAGYPEGITVGPDGAAWFTTSSGGAPVIGRADASGTPSTVVVLPDTTRFPAAGITAGPDQAVWFSQLARETGGPDGIGRVDAAGAYTSWPLPAATTPQRITAGPDGALWFTQRGGIGRITVDGRVSAFPVESATHPSSVVAGPDGAVWFTSDTRLGRVSASGQVTLWPVPGAVELTALVPVPEGGFWLADGEADVVRRFVPPPRRP